MPITPQSRRDFLKFMGIALTASSLPSCQTRPRSRLLTPLPFEPLPPSSQDQLVLAKGFESRVLISWGDPLGDNLQFGYNNDFTAFFPQGSPKDGVLWVNHESVDPFFVTGWTRGTTKRRKDDVVKEMRQVGGSLVHIRQSADGSWRVLPKSSLHRRLDAHTLIPFVARRPIAGRMKAQGTLANCAGGVTPWGTLLTCEENYDQFYGDVLFKNGKRVWQKAPNDLGWSEFFPHPPEHFGWVVEVNPWTGQAKKLTSLGRFSHESATVTLAADGRAVVYSGDDHQDECLYKFVAAKPGSLEEGELFVAQIESGRWLSLDIEKQPLLKQNFIDQTEVLIRAREAAHLLGASRLDRPEDVEICPRTKAVFVTLTNNKGRGNLHGSILKILERDLNPLATEFESHPFLTGGPNAEFSCPDNMVFDRLGNLWMTNDISDSVLNQGEYQKFGNNSLYYIPLQGERAGQVFRVASAPMTAELTGPSFSPDGRTLFLSVQHPGEGSTDRAHPLSRWPLGGDHLPRPSVVTIQGPALDALVK